MFYNNGGMEMVKKRLTYKVQRGDDYTKIADRLYGDKRYRTALMKQNPHVKKVSPGVVINLLDDDPKEMWKKRERGRRKKAASMRKDWESVKRRYGINPDLSEIEPTPITIQPPAPPEPTTWWEDPAFQEGLIGLVESTAESMGLDANVMLEELGLGEGSPLLAEALSTGQAQPQTGSPPSTPPTTDEQKKALKKELGKMGLDADVAMYELGLSDRDPYAWETPQVTTQSSGATGGKTQGDTKDSPGGNIAKTAQPEEPKPPKTPKDMVNLLDEVENEEELDQWREILSTKNFKPEVLHGLEYMAAKKEKELIDYEDILTEEELDTWYTEAYENAETELGKYSVYSMYYEKAKKLEKMNDLLPFDPWNWYPVEVLKQIESELPPYIRRYPTWVEAWIQNLKGELPDYRGIAIAEAFVPKVETIGGVDASAVAAGIAVESAFYHKDVDTKKGLGQGVTTGNPGYGIAQMSDKEKGFLRLVGNQEDPDFAIKAMAARMNAALTELEEHFPKCSAQDKLIIAGLAHNAQFVNFDLEQAAWGVKKIPKSGGSPNWGRFYGEDDDPSAFTAKTRQALSGYQYSRQLMVISYIKDLRELHKRGWELPFGLTENDLDEVEKKVKERFKDQN